MAKLSVEQALGKVQHGVQQIERLIQSPFSTSHKVTEGAAITVSAHLSSSGQSFDVASHSSLTQTASSQVIQASVSASAQASVQASGQSMSSLVSMNLSSMESKAVASAAPQSAMPTSTQGIMPTATQAAPQEPWQSTSSLRQVKAPLTPVSPTSSINRQAESCASRLYFGEAHTSDNCSREENLAIQKEFAPIFAQARGWDKPICYLLEQWVEHDLKIQSRAIPFKQVLENLPHETNLPNADGMANQLSVPASNSGCNAGSAIVSVSDSVPASAQVSASALASTPGSSYALADADLNSSHGLNYWAAEVKSNLDSKVTSSLNPRLNSRVNPSLPSSLTAISQSDAICPQQSTGSVGIPSAVLPEVTESHEQHGAA